MAATVNCQGPASQNNFAAQPIVRGVVREAAVPCHVNAEGHDRQRGHSEIKSEEFVLSPEKLTVQSRHQVGARQWSRAQRPRPRQGPRCVLEYTEVKAVVVELSETIPVDPFAN